MIENDAGLGTLAGVSEAEDLVAEPQPDPHITDSQAAPEERPIIVAEWRRNAREVIRVALNDFKGVDTIDVRAWWHGTDGEWHPGRGGLTLAVRHLPHFAAALAAALQRAKDLGLIEDAVKDKTGAERQRRYRQRHRNGDSNAT